MAIKIKYDYISNNLGEIPITFAGTEANQRRMLNEKGISQQENDILYEHVLDELKTRQSPPLFRISLDSTGLIDKLRGIRDDCTAGKITKDAALELYDQAILDFKSDAMFKVSAVWQAVVKPDLDRVIDMTIAHPAFAEIKAAIEATPCKDVQEKEPDISDDECINILCRTGYITKNIDIKGKQFGGALQSMMK